jgi:hypothetical protein
MKKAFIFNHKNPYSNMNIVKYGESQGYVFPAVVPDKFHEKQTHPHLCRLMKQRTCPE